MRPSSFILLVLILFSAPLLSVTAYQSAGEIKKEVKAYRIQASQSEEAPKIDGVMDEAIWNNAEAALDFLESEPSPGTTPSQHSEVKILYDDEAVYIGAMLYDSSPDSILKQLTQRDEIGNCDFFGVTFDCYRDGLNGLEFIVTAAGVQVDTKYGQNSQDGNWNAVWWSKVGFHDEGWTAEMKIPFSALRFPELPEQQWHTNFVRNIRRHREQCFWNEVDPEVDGYFNQSGMLTDIKGIKPPPRLFFFPYVSAYIENDESQGGNWNEILNGGMDLKYGINDAFTLDMTLIPDFGQVQSDNQVLNLSPFEVQFNENRQFFTEGTELFNKANLFYSRRIGGRPLRYWDVEDLIGEDEEIVENPRESRLMNATKVSGRNHKGLGIGVFNAITSETHARIRNTETGEEYEMLTDPLTNFNLMVLDQNLWTNSYVSLVNTNVFREGSDYEANVAGTEFRLSNKKNTMSVQGSASLSQKYYSDSTDLGHSFNLEWSENSGQFVYGIGNSFMSNTYDRNDLGLNFRNNDNSFYVWTRYAIFEPFGKFNRFNIFSRLEYQRLHKPDEFANFAFYSEAFFLTKGFHAFGLWTSLEPIETYDFFEPRVDGRALNYPKNYTFSGWISTDYRKRFAFDMRSSYRWFDEPGRVRFDYNFSPRFRFSDKLLQVISFERNNFDNDIGWVNDVDEGIIMGRRDQDIHELTFQTNYVFNELMSLSFRLRHYWTRVEYHQYELLQDDGYTLLAEYEGLEDDGSSSHDTNFNAFNIDLVYKWVFSPGSEVSLVWKNSILGEDTDLLYNYRDDLRRTFELDQVNSFSMKVLYFLDYESLRGERKSRAVQ